MFGKRDRSPLHDVLADLRRGDGRSRVLFERELPAETARYGDPHIALPRPLRDALSSVGVDRLYAHQALALDELRAGRNVVLVTPTASGKTLSFTLPVLERLLSDPAARALFVYPTNALVNDQERSLSALIAALPQRPDIGVLTGGTDAATRRAYRARPPRILLTNPELLHMSLLGHHSGWAAFLSGLSFVVLDELHQYRGLFGSHLAMVMRRLRRVCALYGRAPQLIGCSATVGNPGEMAERIGGAPFTVVEGSGAARGPRTLLIRRPPPVRGSEGEQHGDAQAEAVRVFSLLVQRGLGTILFVLSRGAAEAMSMQAREKVGPGLERRIAPYRNGYSAQQRREIEQRLKGGELLGVVATNALEVGIDIGGLDAAVIAGFPGSRSSFWQQAGRAGRGTRPSLVVFVPYDRVVDGYYAGHPEQLLAGRFEDCVVDLANPSVAAAHLVCAAREGPLAAEEALSLSPVGPAALRDALEDGRLRSANGVHIAAGVRGHADVGLRGSGADELTIHGATGEIGTIDRLHLYREAFPGAVYLHAAQRYRVTALDLPRRRVEVEHEPAAYATDPVLQTTVRIVRSEGEEHVQAGAHQITCGQGALQVCRTTTGFRERSLRGARQSRLLPLPPGLSHELTTSGWWTVFPTALRRELEAAEPRRFLSGLHALEHVLPAAVSLRLLCDPRDVVAVYEAEHQALGGPVLFVFDDRAGGAGIAVRAATQARTLFSTTFDIIRSCHCRDGCPGCVVSSSCWRQLDEAGKSDALALLSRLLSPAPTPALPRA